MLIIRVPATTSNFSVGFDAIGMALNLYNEFHFEEAYDYSLQGFDETHKDNNLVLNSYKLFCKANGLLVEEIVKVKIIQAKQEIPIGKGLGSSAACIIAGIIAANKLNNLNKSLTDCATYASKMEGHPDNVFSAIFGGFNASFLDGFKYFNNTFEVSKKLKFALLIPDKSGDTKALRNILPKMLPLKDAVFHLSRMIHLPNALKEGDIADLKKLLKDKIHEAHRSKLIPQYELVKTLADKNHFICSISGSGPSLFLIYRHGDLEVFKELESTFMIQPVLISKGMEAEEVE